MRKNRTIIDHSIILQRGHPLCSEDSTWSTKTEQTRHPFQYQFDSVTTYGKNLHFTFLNEIKFFNLLLLLQLYSF